MPIPPIPIASPLAYVGTVIVLLGIVLILFGLGILSHKWVSPGGRTLAAGSFLGVAGAVLLVAHGRMTPLERPDRPQTEEQRSEPIMPQPKVPDDLPGRPVPRPFVVYSDRLASGWANWSWRCRCKEQSKDYVRTGEYAIRAELEGLGGLKLANPSRLNTKGYHAIEFWLNGGTVGGQSLKLFVNEPCDDGVKNPVDLPTLSPGEWRFFAIPLEDLDAVNIPICAIAIANRTESQQSPFYADDIVLR